jgi:hypothetical protein
VSRLLKAVDIHDSVAFKALVAPNAIIGVNDIGAPLTIDSFPASRLNCAFAGLRAGKPFPTPNVGRYVVVDAEWNCPNTNGDGTHGATITFIVKADRVKAAYVRASKP